MIGSELDWQPRDKCYLCGASGEVLYTGLTDRLFGVSGTWSLRKCSHTECGLAWIDPFPGLEAIPDLYKNYYTHESGSSNEKKNQILTTFGRFVVRLLISLFKTITFSRPKLRSIDLMYLNERKPGTVLDIGCGNGERLRRLKNIGWQVFGQDKDTTAAELAYKKYGIKVFTQPVERLGIPDESFDAIIMNHVLEHLTDPVLVLGQCKRLLKPGGIFVAATPNLESLSHRIFKSNWIGLDLPRHVMLYNRKSLKLLTKRVGFSKFTSYATPVRTQGMAAVSFELTRNNTYSISNKPGAKAELVGFLVHVLSYIINIVKTDLGEELILIAEK